MTILFNPLSQVVLPLSLCCFLFHLRNIIFFSSRNIESIHNDLVFFSICIDRIKNMFSFNNLRWEIKKKMRAHKQKGVYYRRMVCRLFHNRCHTHSRIKLKKSFACTHIELQRFIHCTSFGFEWDRKREKEVSFIRIKLHKIDTICHL